MKYGSTTSFIFVSLEDNASAYACGAEQGTLPELSKGMKEKVYFFAPICMPHRHMRHVADCVLRLDNQLFVLLFVESDF